MGFCKLRNEGQQNMQQYFSDFEKRFMESEEKNFPRNKRHLKFRNKIVEELHDEIRKCAIKHLADYIVKKLSEEEFKKENSFFVTIFYLNTTDAIGDFKYKHKILTDMSLSLEPNLNIRNLYVFDIKDAISSMKIASKELSKITGMDVVSAVEIDGISNNVGVYSVDGKFEVGVAFKKPRFRKNGRSKGVVRGGTYMRGFYRKLRKR